MMKKEEIYQKHRQILGRKHEMRRKAFDHLWANWLKIRNEVVKKNFWKALWFCCSQKPVAWRQRVCLLELDMMTTTVGTVKGKDFVSSVKQAVTKRMLSAVEEKNKARYFRALDSFKVICSSDISKLSTETLLNRIQKGPQKDCNFRFNLLCANVSSEMDLDALQKRLPYNYTGISKWDRMVRYRPWLRCILEKAVDAKMEWAESSYGQERRKQLKTIIPRFVEFLSFWWWQRLCVWSSRSRSESLSRKFREEGMKMEDWPQSPEEDGFYHFCSSSTQIDSKMLIQICSGYAERCKVMNERVKSSGRFHSAQNAVSRMLSFLKVGLQDYVTVKADGAGLKEILRKVRNRRRAADPEVRRAFSDDEIERMYNACNGDLRMTLILTLLREIGLRAGAICHLKFEHILTNCEKDEGDSDGDGTVKRFSVRHLCRVPEKNGMTRSFVPTRRLETDILRYIEKRGEKNLTGMTYVFNERNPNSPYPAASLSYQLRKLGKNANVVPKMHAHAFRHTIVGKLIACGNSINDVSRFMGHKRSRTVEQYYYVPTTEEVMQNMHHNPFFPVKKKKQKIEMDKESSEKIRLLEAKYKSAMVLLKFLQKIVDPNRLKTAVNEQMPDYHQIHDLLLV